MQIVLDVEAARFAEVIDVCRKVTFLQDIFSLLGLDAKANMRCYSKVPHSELHGYYLRVTTS